MASGSVFVLDTPEGPQLLLHEEERSKEDLDDRIMTALRVARQHHLSIWDAALREHKKHPGFQMHGYPHTLEYSFTCACSGVEQEWRIKVTTLKSMLPGARESVIRMYHHHMRRGLKAVHRKAMKAEHKAKALLHQFLSREQRLELRKTGTFTVRGKDGRVYCLRHGGAANVSADFAGKTYALCVLPKEHVPNSDTLLIQKLMLETDPEAFIRLARVKDVATEEVYASGAFLLDETEPVRQKQLEVLDIPEEVLENPREWVETRCRD